VPVFSYTALDPTSRRVRGVIQADTTRQARSILLRQGIRTTGLDLVATKSTRSWQAPIRNIFRRLIALRQRDRILDTFENLLTLLESHVPLEEAWESLSQVKRSGALPVLHVLHEGIRIGRPMSSIMEEFPPYFDEVDVALVRAGENAGELPQALERFITRRRMAGHLLSTFGAALAYPTFLFVFGSAVIVFLTTTVIPNLNTMLVAAGGQVPWPTRVLVVVGRCITLGVLPALFATIFLAVFISRSNSALKLRIAKIALRVPVVGNAWRNWQLAQFCLVLRTLLASGIHLPAALVMAGKTAGQGAVAQSAFALKDHLLEGHDLESSAYAGKRASEADPSGFPTWLWRALAVGQAAGDLVPVLERVGERFEKAANKSASRLAAVLEPVMILIIGAFVGMIAYAALMPIIKLGGVW